MEFRTPVDITSPTFAIQPDDELLFLGSCFAGNIGQRFQQRRLRVTVNPRGTMYNPASILHTLELCPELSPRVAFLTLGTNHVYRLRQTGQIVDNCEKRPAQLFVEQRLGVDECTAYLQQCVSLLRCRRSDVQVVFTVSPIRYRKYGYHESQLSKATLLMAIDRLLEHERSGQTPKVTHASAGPDAVTASTLSYFPAYEIVLDELRDYRFYQPDMLHPSEQAVDYIWEKLAQHYFSDRMRDYLSEWQPIASALQHRPFDPENPDYKLLMARTEEKIEAMKRKYPWFGI